MSGWKTASIPWDCQSCRAFIPAGEPFYNGAPEPCETRPVCLSCILTASASLLPGQPKSIRVEWLFSGMYQPGAEYRLTVDGVEYGVMTVDARIAQDQHVPALLALVRQALKWRVEGKLRPRIAEANPILDELSYVPAEPGPYRHQLREPLPDAISFKPSASACRHLGGQDAAQRGGVILCLKQGCGGNHAREVRCLRCGEWIKYHAVTAWRAHAKPTYQSRGSRRPLTWTAGRRSGASSGRLPVLPLAPKRPPDACSCAGTGRVPPADPRSQHIDVLPRKLDEDDLAHLRTCKRCQEALAAEYYEPQRKSSADLQERIAAGLPIFIKHDPDVARDPQFFSGQGIIGPEVKRATDEIRSHYLAWLRQQGARLSRNLFTAFKAGRESVR